MYYRLLVLIVTFLVTTTASWASRCSYDSPYYDETLGVAKVPFLYEKENGKPAFGDEDDKVPLSIIDMEIALKENWIAETVAEKVGEEPVFFITNFKYMEEDRYKLEGKPLPTINDLSHGSFVFSEEYLTSDEARGSKLASLTIRGLYLNKDKTGERIHVKADVYYDICSDFANNSHPCFPVVITEVEQAPPTDACDPPYVAILEIVRLKCTCPEFQVNMLHRSICWEIYDSAETARFFSNQNTLNQKEQVLWAATQWEGCDCSESYVIMDSFWDTSCSEIAELVPEQYVMCIFRDCTAFYYPVIDQGEVAYGDFLLPDAWGATEWGECFPSTELMQETLNNGNTPIELTPDILE